MRRLGIPVGIERNLGMCSCTKPSKRIWIEFQRLEQWCSTFLYLPYMHFDQGIGRVEDPDAIVRLVEKSDLQTAALLLLSTEIPEPEFRDWPDELAASLTQNASINLSGWSEAKGISAWDLSRGFAKVFGIPPCAFRARARTRQAWRQFARLVCLCRR
jgi:AraC-like DNA-binding protein